LAISHLVGNGLISIHADHGAAVSDSPTQSHITSAAASYRKPVPTQDSQLGWTDAVTARFAVANEAALLELDDATPVIDRTRICYAMKEEHTRPSATPRLSLSAAVTAWFMTSSSTTCPASTNPLLNNTCVDHWKLVRRYRA
jgi:hypothetical protein